MAVPAAEAYCHGQKHHMPRARRPHPLRTLLHPRPSGTSSWLSPEESSEFSHILTPETSSVVAPSPHPLESPRPGNVPTAVPLRQAQCHGFGGRQARLLLGGTASGKGPHLSTPQFSCVSDEDNYHTHMKLF